MAQELIRVVDVYGEVQFDRLFITRIVCSLEDGRLFYLDRVPFDIVLALKRIKGEEIPDNRERLIDIILSMPHIIEGLGKNLSRVIIDEIDENTGVYSATVEFSDGDVTLKRKMVPSHAIFLATLTGKPVYVKKKLVDEQEEFMNSMDMNNMEEDYTDESGEELDDLDLPDF